MKIVIPTYKRADKQVTITQIPEKLRKLTYLIVRQEEYIQYQKYQGQGFNIIPIADLTGIHDTMQAIIDMFDGYILRIDDDIKIQQIDTNTNSMKSIKSPEQFLRLYQWFKQCLDKGIAHAAIPERMIAMQVNLNNNGYPTGKILRNQRYGGVTAYNVDILKLHRIRFDALRIREDYHVNLSLLKIGYPSLMNTKWCHNQVSNSKGGCSMYRNIQVNNQEAVRFVRLHPNCSKLMKKVSKSVQGFTKPHLTVRIFPSRAYRGR